MNEISTTYCTLKVEENLWKVGLPLQKSHFAANTPSMVMGKIKTGITKRKRVSLVMTIACVQYERS
jgi:hypothetical protein